MQVRFICAFGAMLAQCRSHHTAHHSGTAATSSEFNAGCSVPPWQTHYAAGGSGGADWFLRWQAFSTFRNQCPIPTAYSNGDCFSAQVEQSRGTAGYVARHFTRVAVPLAASLSANDFAWMILNSGESSRCFEGNLMLDGWSTSNPRQMLAQPRCYQTLCTSAGLQIILGSGTSALLVCAIQSSKTFALLSHRRQQYNMRSLLILRVFRSRLPCGRWRSYTERLYWCVLCYLI